MFCIEELFPRIYYLQWRDENDKHQAVSFLLTHEMLRNKVHGIRSFGILTCWQWINQIGFTYYSMQQKSYYVDGHERDNVILALSCKQFSHRYQVPPHQARTVVFAMGTIFLKWTRGSKSQSWVWLLQPSIKKMNSIAFSMSLMLTSATFACCGNET